MTHPEDARTIIRTYVATQALFTLSTSVIWGVSTLFLLKAGMSIFQVFLINAAFSAGDLVFQVPTGVIADTLGRKPSFLLSLGTLIVSTLAYVVAYRYDLGFWVYVASSVFLGLGFTFYSGAVEAWMVDALDRVRYTGPRERVFAWGGMAFSGAMVVGSLSGGLLGQVDLELPFVVRSAMLAVTFALAVAFMREPPRDGPALTVRRFAERSREIARAAAGYGLHDRVVRPLLLASATQGFFFLYGFYSWQRFFLDVLGRDLVWVTGVIAALFGASNIAGAALVSRVTAEGKRPAAPILAWTTLAQAVLFAVIGLIGVLLPPAARGIVPFLGVVTLYTGSGVLFGVFRPVRQAYLNPHIRSEERATVLSLDLLFSDAGGLVGQPALGWLSQAVSIPLAWIVSSGVVALGYPLYLSSGRAAEEEHSVTRVEQAQSPPREPSPQDTPAR